jgi:hypothetical protein
MTQTFHYVLNDNEQTSPRIYALNKELAKLPDRDLVIFDTYPKPLAPVVVKNGQVGWIESGPMSNRSGVAFMKETDVRVAGALVRTLPLRPKTALAGDQYCFVQIGRTITGNVLITGNLSDAFCLGGRAED